jgi:23S rRNA pseudouridine1911/1915/1917 synthase
VTLSPSAASDRLETLSVAPEEAWSRLDHWLAEKLPEVSRTRFRILVEEGRVTVDGRTVKASTRLKAGQRVIVRVPPAPPETLIPEPIPLEVVYEDAHLLVLDKPAGMVVHPGAGQSASTLAHALLAHAPSTAGVGGPRRPGIVHRLDKGTSGLLVVAKSQQAYLGLTAELAARRVSRRYLALVHGLVRQPEGIVDAPIGRDPRHRTRMAVLQAGKGRRAVTRFRVLERFKGYTFVEALLETGRTHQIRVHLSSLGHPLVGDEAYGRRPKERTDPVLASLIAGLEGVALHAGGLAFAHPVTGANLEFTSPLPNRIERILSHLRISSG